MSHAGIQALNEDFDFARDAPPEVQRAFNGEVIVKLRLPVKTRLWKWADFAPEPGRTVSPWWLPFNPGQLAVGELRECGRLRRRPLGCDIRCVRAGGEFVRL